MSKLPARPSHSANAQILGAARRYLSALGIWLIAAVGLWALDPPTGPRAQTEGQASDKVEVEREIERPGRTGLPIPRFVSLRKEIVNLRRGPGMRYPIDWVYQRRNLPVEVIDEFESWRQIRDHDGTTGWVHQGLIKGDRFLLVVGKNQTLRRDPTEDGSAVAMLEPGVLVRLSHCEQDWCMVEVSGLGGWLRRGDVFGAYPAE